MKKNIRLYSETGNVEVIVKQMQQIMDTFPNIEFKAATIKQKLGKIPNDKSNPEFYPLVLKSKDFDVFVSEVRCGYRGFSTDAMIEILKIAGFNPSQKTIEKIYNNPNINLTLYKDAPV